MHCPDLHLPRVALEISREIQFGRGFCSTESDHHAKGHLVRFSGQMHGHGKMQMETSNVGIHVEAVLQDLFNDIVDIGDLTKKDLANFCEDALYFLDIAEKWLAKIGPTELRDKVIAYLGEESGKG